VTDNLLPSDRNPSRRAVFGGALGVGIGVPLLAACGSDSEDSSAGGDTGSGGDSGGETGGGTTSSGGIGKTSEVPVGGAKIFKAEKVMVSQPTEGEFRAFSAVCTHQSCAITKLDGDEIECTCHFSRFSIKDGSVTKEPADKPLPELKVTVSGDELVVS
jgi:nitrite reductase/ring-hydroxylating ferredoxin subunit